MPDFVQTAPYDPSAPGIIRNQYRKWAAAHDWLQVTWRTIRWLVLHPKASVPIAVALWLWTRGIPFWLVLPIALAYPIYKADWSQVGLVAAASQRRGFRQSLTVLSSWWRVRLGWSTGARAAGFVQPGRGGRIPHLRHWEITNAGVSAWVTCGRFGWTAARLAVKAEDIASGIERCRAVTVTQGEFPGVARIDFAFADPLAELVPVTALAVPPKSKLTIGITDRGDPATVWRHLPLLVVGMQGSGKSNMLWAAIASMLATGEPFELWVLDPAGGVELWELSNGSPLVRDYAAKPAQMNTLINDLHAEMLGREKVMAGKSRFLTPTTDTPRIYLVVDEWIRMKHVLSKASNSKLIDLLALGRKFGITPIGLSQIVFGHSIGQMERLLFPQAVVFKVKDPGATAAALGAGSEAMGAEASRLKLSAPGIGFVWADNEEHLARFRPPLMTDPIVEMVARGVLPAGIPTTGEGPPEWHNREHVLYRWDAPESGVRLPRGWHRGVLYVGITVDPLRRADQHLSNEKKQVLRTPGVVQTIVERFSVETHPDEVAAGRTVKQIAESAEKTMIQELRPPLNIAHNGRRKALPRRSDGRA